MTGPRYEPGSTCSVSAGPLTTRPVKRQTRVGAPGSTGDFVGRGRQRQLDVRHEPGWAGLLPTPAQRTSTARPVGSRDGGQAQEAKQIPAMHGVLTRGRRPCAESSSSGTTR